MVEIIGLDDGEAENQEHLGDLERDLLNLGHTLTVAEHLYEFSGNMEEYICGFFGDNPYCVGASFAILCVPNPPRIACDTVALASRIISNVILVGVTIAYQAVEDIFEIATLGEPYLLSCVPHLCNYEFPLQ